MWDKDSVSQARINIRSHSNSVSAVKRRNCANLTVEQKGNQKGKKKMFFGPYIPYLVAVLSTFDGFQPCNCQSFCQGNGRPFGTDEQDTGVILNHVSTAFAAASSLAERARRERIPRFSVRDPRQS